MIWASGSVKLSVLPEARSAEFGELVSASASGDAPRGEDISNASSDGEGMIELAESECPGWISGALALVAAGVLMVAVAMNVGGDGGCG